MPVSYFVRYEGQAENADAFLAYYRNSHVPVLARFPGIRRIILHTPVSCQDPYAIHPDRFSLLVQMVFDSPEHLDRALHSPARAAARADFGGFPPFHGTVYHQAVLSHEVFAQ